MKKLLFIFLVACSSNKDFPEKTDGYYIESSDRKISMFCLDYNFSYNSIMGIKCKDMNCAFAADRKIVLHRIFIEEGIIMESKNFEYKYISCGPKE